MNEQFFSDAMNAIGLTPIYVDGKVDLDQVPLPSTSRRLHPSRKKCVCGMTGTKHQFLKHMDQELEQSRRNGLTVTVFWSQHGEVPYYEGDE